MEYKAGNCIYCQERVADTDDHVPPKRLFAKNQRKNLIKVPCCRECNAGFQKDDDHFALLSTGDITGSNESARHARTNTIRGLKRPEARGFARHVHDHTEYEVARTPAGVYHRRAKYQYIDADRIRATIIRCVRGIYFDECKIPLPRHIDVEVQLIQELETNPNLHEEYRTNFLVHVDGKVTRRIGDGFTYAKHVYPEDLTASVWRLIFWDSVEFFAWTLDRELYNNELDRTSGPLRSVVV